MAGLSTASPQAFQLTPQGFPGFPFLSLPDGTSNLLPVNIYTEYTLGLVKLNI